MSRLSTLAIATAGVSLATSLVAVGVVVTRGSRGASPIEVTVDADDVVKLNSDVVEASEHGLLLRDDKLREALGLESGDELVRIGGRDLERALDVREPITAASIYEPAVIDVDIVRDSEPVLVRWKIDGSLRDARNLESRQPRRTTDPPSAIGGFTRGSIGLGSLRGGSTLRDPFANPYSARDPLVDSIVKIDDLHYMVPRSSVDRFLTNPTQIARGGRIVPWIENGQVSGFKLYGIRPGSLFAALGLKNGDRIRTVNGLSLGSASDALDAYTKLRDAKLLDFAITRRGDEISLQIEIR